jgi:hypothetical protein
MRFSLKDVGVDVRLMTDVRPVVTQWTYGLEPDIQSVCDRETIFSPIVS